MYHTPILFIVFNRPESALTVLDKIRTIKPLRLYIAADGPREYVKGELELCQEVREIVNMVDWKCEVFTLFQNKNLGCKAGVETAINWFFSKEEAGIILEDDCLPNNDFFSFCEELLEHHKNDDQIMAISGRNSLGRFETSDSYLYSRMFREWGWATWRRSWKLYSINNDDLKGNDLSLNIFDDPVKNKYYLNCLTEVLENEHDTWDYVWAFRILINDGLVIIPKMNLVSNIGLNSGTHFGNNDLIQRELYDVPVYEMDKGLIHPVNKIVDEYFDDLSFKTLFPYLYPKKYTIWNRLSDSFRYRFVSKLKKK